MFIFLQTAGLELYICIYILICFFLRIIVFNEKFLKFCFSNSSSKCVVTIDVYCLPENGS